MNPSCSQSTSLVRANIIPRPRPSAPTPIPNHIIDLFAFFISLLFLESLLKIPTRPPSPLKPNKAHSRGFEIIPAKSITGENKTRVPIPRQISLIVPNIMFAFLCDFSRVRLSKLAKTFTIPSREFLFGFLLLSLIPRMSYNLSKSFCFIFFANFKVRFIFSSIFGLFSKNPLTFAIFFSFKLFANEFICGLIFSNIIIFGLNKRRSLKDIAFNSVSIETSLPILLSFIFFLSLKESLNCSIESFIFFVLPHFTLPP